MITMTRIFSTLAFLCLLGVTGVASPVASHAQSAAVPSGMPFATAHRLRAFDDLAFAALSSGGMNEVGCAANFAKVREWQREMSDRFAALCLDRAEAADGTEWYFPRMLEYLLQIGKKIPTDEAGKEPPHAQVLGGLDKRTLCAAFSCRGE
ncbi:MAG TPA: hypothetical protein VF550_04795 [Polyangia bacterium]